MLTDKDMDLVMERLTESDNDIVIIINYDKLNQGRSVSRILITSLLSKTYKPDSYEDRFNWFLSEVTNGHIKIILPFTLDGKRFYPKDE